MLSAAIKYCLVSFDNLQGRANVVLTNGDVQVKATTAVGLQRFSSYQSRKNDCSKYFSRTGLSMKWEYFPGN